jgi:DNA helicase II / ATP-dependent DNA helicase PcrA
MDQFAVIRHQARALRTSANLSDSSKAIETAQAAASHRGLSIRRLAPDHPELEGGHGVLDRQYNQILVRNNLPDSELAEVIAHELGHFEVHDGPERGYYPRSSETVGDPNQRIETYGVKERREAQANSFARELILPRSLAKRLFLGGDFASAISSDLAIRYETTLQQMADGLLLPDLAFPAEETAIPLPPPQNNEAQERAVAHRGTPFLLSAGPGTGKTKTLTARIVALIEEGVRPSKILALTFSNKAARELQERVHKAAGPQGVNIWAGTFHSFGLDTIRKHHALFNLTEDPKVIDGSASVAMLEEALPALGIVHYLNLIEPALALRDILRAISRAKDELCGWERYRALADDMAKSATSEEEIVAAEKAAEVALVYEHYQKQLEAEKSLDYGDLIMLPALKMQEDPDFRDAMREQFTHVHVDEYQDINRASAMLVKELAGDGSNLWMVGDARQSIYRFRGASAANIARFELDYEAGQRDGLDQNYRSTPQIVEFYTAFGGTMKVSQYAGSPQLSAAGGQTGPTPSIHLGDDSDAEMDILAASIRALEQEGVALRDQTILSRSNGSLAKVAEELSARGLPVLYLGPLFQRSEVKDLLCVLSLISDDLGTSLVRVGGFPEYAVPLEDRMAVLDAARASETRLLELLKRLENVDQLSPEGRAGLTMLARHLGDLSQGSTPWHALSRFIFDGSDYFRTVLAGQEPSDDLRRVAVRQLLDSLRNMPAGGAGSPIRRALDRIRHMILLADERDLRHLPPELEGLDGVRLMTIHASKGLEFEAVHLSGLYAGAIPSANRPPACPPPINLIPVDESDAHEAEEECILFVAMSRAKSHLKLYRPRTRNGRNSSPSRFLDRLSPVSGAPRAPIVRVHPRESYAPIRAPAAPEQLTSGDVESYTMCPRRFFYERVLNLSRRGKTAAYLDAHGCVQKVIAYVRALGPEAEYDRDEATRLFQEAWARSGLEDHPFASAYQRLTTGMLDRLHLSAGGSAARDGELTTHIGGEVIAVRADRIINDQGRSVVRTIKSGRQSAGDPDRLSTTMLIKAVEESFGATAELENHYLMTGLIVPMTQTKAKFDKRLADCGQAVSRLRAGDFPPEADDFRCPRCPYLFVCAAPESKHQ